MKIYTTNQGISKYYTTQVAPSCAKVNASGEISYVGIGGKFTGEAERVLTGGRTFVDLYILHLLYVSDN